jgi:hypothetical protein
VEVRVCITNVHVEKLCSLSVINKYYILILVVRVSIGIIFSNNPRPVLNVELE